MERRHAERAELFAELAVLLERQVLASQEYEFSVRYIEEVIDGVATAFFQYGGNQADTLTRRTMAKLFKRGNDPLTVMKWKEIIDLMETATDRAEDVANVLEGVVLEHA